MKVIYPSLGLIHEQDVPDRNCYFHYTIATDTQNIRTVFFACQDIILSGNLKRASLF